MKLYKLFYLLFSIALLALMVAACSGGSESITLGDLPVYTSARSIGVGESLFADGLAEAVDNLAEDPVTELQRYAVSDAEGDVLCDFYAKSLTAAGWKKVGRIDNDNPPAVIEIWTRGQGANEQVLFVAVVQDPAGGNDSYLVTALATKQP
jgi:hypothetical protein